MLRPNSPNSVMNKSIVIHAYEDDLGLAGNAGSIASGNAGGRIACGTIVKMVKKKRGPPQIGKRNDN